MKVAYIFSTQGHTVSYKLGKMILPQLEENTHGVDVVGMFFFEDNNYVLVKGDPLGERLMKVAKRTGMLLMAATSAATNAASPTSWSMGRPLVASRTCMRRWRGICRIR